MTNLRVARMVFGALLVACTSSPAEAPDRAQDLSRPPEGVRITPDVVYGHKYGMALTFDVYQPAEQNGAAVAFVNSGGWVSWFPSFYEETHEGRRLLTDDELARMNPLFRQASFRPLLVRGFTVFAVRHGSSPKFQMSEIVADLRRAVRVIRSRADQYGVDPDRIGLWGGSAGGHLALLLGTTGDVGVGDAGEESAGASGRVSAVVAYFPPTDLWRLWGYWTPADRERFPAISLQDEEYKQYSPIFFATSDDPPTLIIHGDKDELVPIIEGESMYQALLNAGATARLVTVPGAAHGFIGEQADTATAETVAWFVKYLAPKR